MSMDVIKARRHACPRSACRRSWENGVETFGSGHDAGAGRADPHVHFELNHRSHRSHRATLSCSSSRRTSTVRKCRKSRRARSCQDIENIALDNNNKNQRRVLKRPHRIDTEGLVCSIEQSSVVVSRQDGFQSQPAPLVYPSPCLSVATSGTMSCQDKSSR